VSTVLSAHEFWWDSHPDFYKDWHRSLAPVTGGAVLGSFGIGPDLLVEDGLFQGVTTNPALIRAAIDSDLTRSPGVDSLHSIADFWCEYRRSIERAAAYGLGTWLKSNGRYGWVCAQVDPWLLGDSAAMFDHGMELSRLAPNVMVKVPGCRAGFAAIAELITAGASVNATATVSVSQAVAFCRAVKLGLRERKASADVPARYVFTLMLGRIGRHPSLAEDPRTTPALGVRWLEIAVARAVHRQLANSALPVDLLFSSARFDDGAAHPALHLTHTPPGAIFTINPAAASHVVSRSVLLAAKSDREPPPTVRDWYDSIPDAINLLNCDVPPSAFEDWPQFQDAISMAQAAASVQSHKFIKET